MISDFAINDFKGIAPNDTRTPRMLAAAMDSLARHVIDKATKHRPRVYIHVEALAKGLGCAPSTATHLAVATRHAVPFLSFMASICNDSAVVARTTFPRSLYRAGCGWLDREGFDCGVHPGPKVHSTFASLLTAYLAWQFADAAHDMAMPGGGAEASGAKACRTAQKSPVAAQEEAEVVAAAAAAQAAAAAAPLAAASGEREELEALEALEGCPVALSMLDVTGGCTSSVISSGHVTQPIAKREQEQSKEPHVSSTFTPLRAVGWRCYEDRPGKPGWIAEWHAEDAAGASDAGGASSGAAVALQSEGASRGTSSMASAESGATEPGAARARVLEVPMWASVLPSQGASAPRYLSGEPAAIGPAHTGHERGFGRELGAKLVVGFLRSFRGVGRANVTVFTRTDHGAQGEHQRPLEHGPERGQPREHPHERPLAQATIDALWASPTSQMDRVVLPLRSPVARHGRVLPVTVRIELLRSTAKWKLLYLHSC